VAFILVLQVTLWGKSMAWRKALFA